MRALSAIRVGVIVLALVGAPVGVGIAVAGHLTTTVPSYTGCLHKASGTVSGLAEGPAPAAPCTMNETQVHLSGGDLTGIVTPATGGLQGGVTEGTATLGLSPSFQLPQGCASGQLPKWNGSGWVCAQDVDTDTDTPPLVLGTASNECTTFLNHRPQTHLGLFSYVVHPDFQLAPYQNGWSQLCQLALPAGRYQISANASFFNTASLDLQGNQREVNCELVQPTAHGPVQLDTRQLTLWSFWTGSLTLEEAHTFTAPGSVQVRCNVHDTGDDRSYVYQNGRVRINALQVRA